MSELIDHMTASSFLFCIIAFVVILYKYFFISVQFATTRLD